MMKSANCFGFVAVGLGLAMMPVVLPSEGGAFCRPTDFCVPLPVSLSDDPAPEQAPQLSAARPSIGASVSLSSLNGSSVSYRV